jgi:hypothetical protein
MDVLLFQTRDALSPQEGGVLDEDGEESHERPHEEDGENGDTEKRWEGQGDERRHGGLPGHQRGVRLSGPLHQ